MNPTIYMNHSARYLQELDSEPMSHAEALQVMVNAAAATMQIAANDGTESVWWKAYRLWLAARTEQIAQPA